MTSDEIRRQLHQQAKESQDEVIATYVEVARRLREEGDPQRAAYYDDLAEQESHKPLPNAA
jgi:hypothetical protein